MPHLDLQQLIITVGYLGVFFMVFAENGLFFGLFFPGDSLLFTAGFLASQGFLNIYILTIGVVLCSILGNSAGFWTGKKFIGWLLNRDETWYFKKRYLHKAHDFYQKHGGKALILGRFVPTVRTFVPIVAGMVGMNHKKFLAYNITGGVFWGAGVTLAGFYLGRAIPGVDKYLLPIVLAIIIVSVMPGVWHMRHELISLGKKYRLTRTFANIFERWLGEKNVNLKK